MEETSFCYWLQGFFELSNSNKLTTKQVQQIKDHLDLVFTKVTPNRNKEKKSAGLPHFCNAKLLLPMEPNLDFESEFKPQKKSNIRYCSNANDLGSRKIC